MRTIFKRVTRALMALVLCGTTSAAMAQVAVQGTVIDDTGEPVIGATVMEKGVPGNGTATDIDGKFKVNVKSNKAQLVVSYVGMTTQTYDLKGRPT